uniref:Uncharacterized protein n=1 Tax=Phlebotomus papatasi TaxID=29031 RepID=A0A1B0DQD6_PHLPP
MECIEIAGNCRACQMETQEESQKVFIFTTAKLPDIFKETTSLDIQENDGLPKVLCYPCYDRLLDAYNFRKMCSAAALHFQRILSMDILEEKYIPPIPPEDPSDIHLTNTSKEIPNTHPDDFNAPNSYQRNLNCLPDRKDSPTDFLDMLSIDERLPEVLKTDPDDNIEVKDIFPESNIPGEDSRFLPDRGDCQNELETDPDDDAPLIFWKFKNTYKKQEEAPDLQKKKEFIHRKSRQDMRTRKKYKNHRGLKSSSINQNVCEICGVQKATEAELSSHIDTHKKGDMWFCVTCDYKAVEIVILRHHVKVVHQGVKDFYCARCDRFFSTAASQKYHMLRHEGIKNFECSVCGVRKVSLSELKSHMITHTKEKLWSCEFCTFKSSLRGNLKRHVKVVHHKIKEHHCSQCNKSFATPRTSCLRVASGMPSKPGAALFLTPITGFKSSAAVTGIKGMKKKLN